MQEQQAPVRFWLRSSLSARFAEVVREELPRDMLALVEAGAGQD